MLIGLFDVRSERREKRRRNATYNILYHVINTYNFFDNSMKFNQISNMNVNIDWAIFYVSSYII